MENYNLLAPESKVWIYQSSAPFLEEDIETLNTQLGNFAKHWVSHNQQLMAYAKLYHNQFIVLMVDESRAGASGCSIDKSVHFMKQIENHYGVNLFDRLTFAYQDKDGVQTLSKNEFAEQFANGNITEDTLVFDNLVKTKADFEERWLKPLKESWHKRFVKLN